MKLLPKVEETLKSLESLTYEELSELSQQLNHHDGIVQRKYKEEEPARNARYEQEAKERAERRAHEEAARPLLIEFLKARLKEGDHVKFSGCKDGHGYRDIIKIDSGDEDQVPQVIGWKVGSCYNRNTRKYDVLERSNVVTTNGIDKITQIYDSTTGKWNSVKDLMAGFTRIV